MVCGASWNEFAFLVHEVAFVCAQNENLFHFALATMGCQNCQLLAIGRRKCNAIAKEGVNVVHLLIVDFFLGHWNSYRVVQLLLVSVIHQTLDGIAAALGINHHKNLVPPTLIPCGR